MNRTRRFDVDLPADRKPKPAALDYIFLFMTITQFGKVWYWPIDAEMRIEIDKPLGALFHALVILAVPYIIMNRWGDIVRFSTRTINIYLLLLLTLIFFSCLWSLSPTQSFITAIDVLCIYLVALNTAVRFSIEDLFTALYKYLAVVTLISVLLSIAHIDFALMKGLHNGKWRGLFPHKNNFSEFLVMMWVPLMFNRRYIRTSNLKFYGLGLVIFASYPFIKSSSGIALFVIAIAASILAGQLNKISGFFAKFFAISLFALIVYFISISDLVSDLSEQSVIYLGRDLTFTGRTKIWEFYYTQISQGPLFGKGYAVYYLDEDLLSQARFVLFPTIRSPHNSYLALAHGVGWLGVALLAIWVFLALKLSLSMSSDSKGRATFALLLCYAIFGFFEVSGGALPSIGLLTTLIFVMALQRQQVVAAEPEPIAGKDLEPAKAHAGFSSRSVRASVLDHGAKTRE